MSSAKGTLGGGVTLPPGAAVLTSAQVIAEGTRPMCLWVHFVNHRASYAEDTGLLQVCAELQRRRGEKRRVKEKVAAVTQKAWLNLYQGDSSRTNREGGIR